MATYAILQNPGHNRVYFQASRAMAFAELRLSCFNLENKVENLREGILGGVPYLLFDTNANLSSKHIKIISRLSFVYAIFERTENYMIPIEVSPGYYFENDDITTILKYNGKTNELFTRMMLNIAVFCSKFNIMDKLTILDPLCGKGTTIFEGILLGNNVCGVEADGKLVQETYTFLKKYLEVGRHKHCTHRERQGVKKYTAQKYQINIAGNNGLNTELIAADTRNVGEFFRKNTFNVIVGDLPYGVQHKTQKPLLSTVEEALPGWHKVLKPGGSLAIAWNLFIIDRVAMEKAFKTAGFKIALQEEDFEHRVDQAIRRDLIVGVKQ